MNRADYKEFMNDMRDELIKIFKRPEFINRWKIEVTNILTKKTIDKIVYSKMAVHESSWFKDHHILINYEDVMDGDQTIDGKKYFYEYLSSVGVSPEDGARPLERTIDEVLTDEIFEQLYFLGRKPQDYFIVNVSLSGHAPGTFVYGNSGRKTVQDRRQTHITVKRIRPEEYDNYLLTS